MIFRSFGLIFLKKTNIKFEYIIFSSSEGRDYKLWLTNTIEGRCVCMELELSKLQVRMCVICCILTIIMILKNCCMFFVVSVAAVPVAIVVTNLLLSKEKKLDVYIEYFNSFSVGDESSRIIAINAIRMIDSYIKVRASLDDILYVNYNVIVPFREFESQLRISEDKMKRVMGKIYSRLRIADARGNINESDYKYFKEYFDIGQEALNESVALLIQISEMGNNNFDASALNNYTFSLKELNEKRRTRL